MDLALQWLNLAVRWIHVITGIAWIGTSFYFNWLNDQIRPPEAPEEGVGGELWSVHGGGFYRVSKYVVAPKTLPRTLHWFKWEAYATWLSGFVLLALIYYLGADTYLVDRGVSPIPTGWAVAVGVGTLAAGWLVYDLLCRSPLGAREVPFAVVGLGLLTATAFGLSQVFGSRGAYIHVGALIGTIMAANVFFVIIPSQRRMVDAMTAGRAPDAAEGKAAARRSRHNNYLTLPVVFIMVSNHYPMTYGHRYGWAILAALMLIGAVSRHAFNLANLGRGKAWLLPASALGLVALAVVSRPPAPAAAGDGAVEYATVRAILERRCVPCHAEQPTQPGVPAPPLGVMLDTPERVQGYVSRIDALTVQTRTMPLGNLTGMTEEERGVLATWISQGGRVE